MYDSAAVAFVLAYFMVIWLKTNAFIEYMTLFRLEIYFHIGEYNSLHKEGYGGNYVDFLFEYYRDSFLIRLLSCPVCLSFWLGAIAALFVPVVQAGLIASLTLFFYLVFNRLL
jgi:hypothetical protein